MFKQMSIAMFGLVLASSAFAAAPAESSASPMKWQEGKSYFLVEPPQPTASGSKIEVLEVSPHDMGRGVLGLYEGYPRPRILLAEGLDGPLDVPRRDGREVRPQHLQPAATPRLETLRARAVR